MTKLDRKGRPDGEPMLARHTTVLGGFCLDSLVELGAPPRSERVTLEVL